MPLPFWHYSIVWAWTTVPLFIESDGTMLHLNLLLRHRGFVPSLKLYHLGLCRLIRTAGNVSQPKCHHHLHFYDFTSITLLDSDFSAKKKSGSFELEVQCRIESSNYSVCNVYVRCGCLKRTVLYFIMGCFFLFVLLLFVCCWRWSRPYIFACVSAFPGVVVQFYTHTQTHTHIKTKWCLDIKEIMQS